MAGNERMVRRPVASPSAAYSKKGPVASEPTTEIMCALIPATARPVRLDATVTRLSVEEEKINPETEREARTKDNGSHQRKVHT